MKVNRVVQCVDFPCLHIRRAIHIIPNLDADPARVSIMLFQ